jgi:hypothetical protein
MIFVTNWFCIIPVKTGTKPLSVCFLFERPVTDCYFSKRD